jgi:hypothetical protein
MPLWQEAARREGAAGGFGEARAGLSGAGVNCADAGDEKARDAAIVTITARIPDEGISINATGRNQGESFDPDTLIVSSSTNEIQAVGRRSVRAWLPHQAVADAGHHTIPVPLLAGGIVDQHAVHELAAEVAAVVPDPVALTDASSAKLMVSTTSGMNAASEKSFIDGCANRHPPHPAMQQ